MSSNSNQSPFSGRDPAAQDIVWYRLSPNEVASQLQVDPTKGLNKADAKQRLEKYGRNILAGRKKESGFRAFLRQYKDLMQIILIAAAIISLVFTGQIGTSLLLFGLTIFNATLSLRQESKAEESLVELSKKCSKTSHACVEMGRRPKSTLQSWFQGTLC
jgi:Ca2+-transporting ATPase